MARLRGSMGLGSNKGSFHPNFVLYGYVAFQIKTTRLMRHLKK